MFPSLGQAVSKDTRSLMSFYDGNLWGAQNLLWYDIYTTRTTGRVKWNKCHRLNELPGYSLVGPVYLYQK